MVAIAPRNEKPLLALPTPMLAVSPLREHPRVEIGRHGGPGRIRHNSARHRRNRCFCFGRLDDLVDRRKNARHPARPPAGTAWPPPKRAPSAPITTRARTPSIGPPRARRKVTIGCGSSIALESSRRVAVIPFRARMARRVRAGLSSNFVAVDHADIADFAHRHINRPARRRDHAGRTRLGHQQALRNVEIGQQPAAGWRRRRAWIRPPRSISNNRMARQREIGCRRSAGRPAPPMMTASKIVWFYAKTFPLNLLSACAHRGRSCCFQTARTAASRNAGGPRFPKDQLECRAHHHPACCAPDRPPTAPVRPPNPKANRPLPKRPPHTHAHRLRGCFSPAPASPIMAPISRPRRTRHCPRPSTKTLMPSGQGGPFTRRQSKRAQRNRRSGTTAHHPDAQTIGAAYARKRAAADAG